MGPAFGTDDVWELEEYFQGLYNLDSEECITVNMCDLDVAIRGNYYKSEN